MRVRRALIACAVIAVLGASACGSSDGTAPPVTPASSAVASAAVPTVAVTPLNPEQKTALFERFDDRWAAEQAMLDTFDLIKAATPELTSAERAATLVEVGDGTPCNGEPFAKSPGRVATVGRQSQPGDTSGSAAVSYCGNGDKPGIYYSVEAVRDLAAAQNPEFVRSLIFAFAAYLAGPDGARVPENAALNGCAEGRVVHALLWLSLLKDKFEAYSSPQEVQGQKLIAFNKAVETGRC